MRKRMRYFGALCFATLLCAGVLFTSAATVHAEEDDPYDFSTHESGGGYKIMDNYHGYECNVTLYLLTQDNINYTSYKIPYPFTCYSHLPIDHPFDLALFSYQTYTPNGKEVAMVGDATVYSYNFSIKDGDYTFSYPEANGDISVLTSTFEAPFVDPQYGSFYTFDDIENGYEEIVTIESGQHVRIYGLCGEFRWCQEASAEFIEWAKEFDQNFDVDDGSGDDPLSQDKKEVEDVVEDASESTENTVSDMSSDTIVEEEVMPSNDETQTEEMLQPTPEDVSSSSEGMGGVPIAIIAIFSLVVIGLIIFAMIKLVKKK